MSSGVSGGVSIEVWAGKASPSGFDPRFGLVSVMRGRFAQGRAARWWRAFRTPAVAGSPRGNWQGVETGAGRGEVPRPGPVAGEAKLG